MTTVSIIGAGRVGTALGAALRLAGFAVRAVSDLRPRNARESARFIEGAAALADNVLAASAAKIIFLCVPDREIKKAAEEMARSGLDASGKIIFHTSGAVPASALSSFRKTGGAVASFHPVQSFARREASPDVFKGVTFSLEGDGRAIAAARRIVRALGGRPLVLKEDQKAAFHAACSIASNYLVVLLEMAGVILRRARVEDRNARRALLPLVQGTLRNVNNLDARRALTGPIIRGDAETVARHLDALRRLPRHLEAYRALGRLALDLAEQNGLPRDKVRALRTLLGDG